MALVTAVPSLSPKGWVTDTQNKADLLMTNFYATDQLQTVLFQSQISSLPYIVRKYSHDSVQLSNNLQAALERYFSRYYDGVIVEVKAGDSPTEQMTKRFTYYIYVKVSDANGEYVVGRLLQTEETRIYKYTKLASAGQ